MNKGLYKKGFTQSLENGFAFSKRARGTKPFFSAGFTLVEIIIAVTLFTVVATISAGALIGIFDANNKSRTSKIVVDNLNIAIEDMTRTIKFGTAYHCGSGGTLTNPQNCSTGSDFLALSFNGTTNIYRKNGNTIEKSINGGSSYIPVTEPGVVIQNLTFYVFGTDTADQLQPYAVIVIKGYVGNKPTSQTNFSIQTTVSQRALDI